MHGTLARELSRLEQLRLLDEAEIIVEIELVLLGTDPGALVVTSERVLFLRTPLLRKTKVLSIPFDKIKRVITSEGGFHGKEKGVLTICRQTDDRGEEIEFQLWSAGYDRAEEISRSILKERDLSQDRLVKSRSSTDEATTGEALRERQPEVVVGRGVSSYVRDHGGELYVWRTLYGGGFDKVHAETERPRGLEFVSVDAVEEFGLYVQQGFPSSSKLRVTRRWWGLRDGISVDTGLVLSGGA